MQIIIPMSGFGERFRRVGYNVPKPLIRVNDKPIIQHVVELFPSESSFLFICNEDHLNTPEYSMREQLEKIAPSSQIFSIPSHKLGPVNAVLQVADSIVDDEPCIINYCDFSCYWDYADFKSQMAEPGIHGGIPAYKGFHPHSLGKTNYAYMQHEELNLKNIKEKEPFTDNRMEEFASSGTYYFASGELLKKALGWCVQNKLSVGGEYYVSLAYRYLLEQGLTVKIYELEHFMQWGTPEDLGEYNKWSDIFSHYARERGSTPSIKGHHAVVVPMAGRGSRFSERGYQIPKPMLQVKGMPMVLAALNDLPKTDRVVFVARGGARLTDVMEQITARHPLAKIVALTELTDGQAISCSIGLDALKESSPDFSGAVTFGACDNGAIYNQDRFQEWLVSGQSDVLVWVARGHIPAIRRPAMFGWVDCNDNRVRSMSVKQPLGSPPTDPVFTGTVSFRSEDIFRSSLERLLSRDGRVNGEFYLDSCINDALALGFECETLEVEHYISWGTPDEYETFNYWQNCFAKWHSHAFRGFG